MKILVIGREGQLARGLAGTANVGFEVVAIGRPEIDLTDLQSAAEAIARERPDVVVNAAAYTAVDRAESEPAVATAVNASGAEHVARACAAGAIPLIHLSTDYVFDGSKKQPYVENDAVGPINAYGRSKLEGEERVARVWPRHLILRTAWVHSPWGNNFVRNMLRLAAERPEIRVVDDQWGSPTYAPHLAEVVLALARKIKKDAAAIPWGTYHAVNAGDTTWCGFAREVFRRAREQGLPAAEVVPIGAADYPTPARRPMNSRLDCAALRRSFGLQLPDWRVGVRDCVARLAAAARPGTE